MLLPEAGHEACHVDEIGLRHADDAQLWAYAVREGTVILTKDDVFLPRDAFLSRMAARLSGSVSETARALRSPFG